MEILPFLILLVNILLLVGVVLTKTGFSENIGLEFDLVSTFILVFNTTVQIILYAWLYYVNKSKASKETTYLDLEKGSFGRAWLLFSMAFNLQTLVILIINAVTTQGLSLMIILFIAAFGILTLILYGVEFFRLFQQGQKNVEGEVKTVSGFYQEIVDQKDDDVKGDGSENIDNPFNLAYKSDKKAKGPYLNEQKFVLTKSGNIYLKNSEGKYPNLISYKTFSTEMLETETPPARRVIPFTKAEGSERVVLIESNKIDYIDKEMRSSNVANFNQKLDLALRSVDEGMTGRVIPKVRFSKGSEIYILQKNKNVFLIHDKDYAWLVYYAIFGDEKFVEIWDFNSVEVKGKGGAFGRAPKSETAAQPKGKPKKPKLPRGVPKGGAPKGT